MVSGTISPYSLVPNSELNFCFTPRKSTVAGVVNLVRPTQVCHLGRPHLFTTHLLSS